MEKKTYVSVIDKIIEVLDNDIDLFLENFEVKSRRHYCYIGERAEYCNLINTHLVPIELLCEKFRWNNTFLHLSDIFDKFIIEFIEDYNTLKNTNYYELPTQSRSELIKRRFRFREYLRFEFIERLIKHLKEDANKSNMYGEKQLTFKGLKQPERVYRATFVSDIEKLLQLKEIPESLYRQSISVLNKYLVGTSSLSDRVPIHDIIANIKTHLSGHNCTDPSILKYLLVALLFVDEDEFNLRNYETVPGESLKTIK